MQDIERRAIAAYYRSNAGGYINHPQQPPDVVEHGGLRYVVLSNVNGTLAVYRVRSVNGQDSLKGLKRWPAAVAAPVGC